MALDCEHCANYAANFRRALDLFVGNGRPYPVEVLSDLTGIAVNTLYAYKRGETQPSFSAAMELIAALPAGFGNMVMAPTGLTGASKPDAVNSDARVLHTSVCSTALALAERLEDDIVDHRERETLKPILLRLQGDVSAYLAGNVQPIKGAAE